MAQPKLLDLAKQRIAHWLAPQTSKQARGDGWQNILTGIGVSQRDKRVGTTFATDALDQGTLEELWRGDDLAARIVETLPDQALREGFEVRIQAPKENIEEIDPLATDEESEEEIDPLASKKPLGEDKEVKPDDEPIDEEKALNGQLARKDAFPMQGSSPALPEKPKAPPKPIKQKDDSTKQQAEEFAEKFKDLKFEARLHEALCQSRAYGGAVLFLGADDGQKTNMPLDEERIKTFDWITVLNAFEIQPSKYYTDPRAPKFGEPELYQIRALTTPIGAGQVPSYMDVHIHESRLVIFEGIKVSRRQLLEGPAPGWGDSVLVRPHQILSDFNLSWGSASIILQDYGQAVFKIEGLAELLATDQDNAVINRAKMIDLMRSTARALMLDTNEDFERKGTPLTGYGDLLDKLCLRLSAAAKIPVTFLMGQAPAGLNATGDSDIRIFYDSVREYQRKVVKPAIEKVARLLSLAKNGPTKGQELKNYNIYFPSLWQPTDKERAETRYIQAQTDEIYINASVVTPEEIAESRFGGDEWSAETVIDFEAREQAVKDFEVATKEYEVEKKEAMKNAPKDASASPFPPKTETPAPKVTEGLQS